MFDNDTSLPVGILVYKNQLNDDYDKFGIHGTIELKTLFVINAKQNSSKGIGSCLLAKCLNDSKKLKAKSIIVTVSEQKQESLKFFQKNGFCILNSEKGKYQPGVIEHTLVKVL